MRFDSHAAAEKNEGHGGDRTALDHFWIPFNLSGIRLDRRNAGKSLDTIV